MKKVLVLASLCVLVGQVVRADECKYEEKTFTTQVMNVRLQGDLIEQGKDDEDDVSTTAKVCIFPSSLVIKDVRHEDASHGKEIDFLIKYLKANLEGTADDILSFWSEDSKVDVAETVNNPQFFARNRAMMLQNPGLEVVGFVDQGDTISVLRRFSPMFLMGVNLRKDGDQLHLTNYPSDDMSLAIIEADLK